MIRVANVVLDQRFSGPHSRIVQVGERLRRAGYETLVILPPGELPYRALLARAGLRAHQLGLSRIRETERVRSLTRWLRRLPGEARDLARLLRREDVALVHANGVLNLQAALAARRSGAALVWHLNDVIVPRGMARLMMVFVRRLADVVALSSNAVGEFYAVRDGRTRVLYPPVDCDRYAERNGRDRLRSEWGVGSSAVVGMIGALHPGKGHRFFLNAAAAIRAEGLDARFVIVGARLASRERYATELEELVERLDLSRDVRFLGLRWDVAEVLSAMDVFVHPSLSESAGMVVMEAAAAGLPVVASRTGGVPEILGGGGAGMLVAPGDSMAIARSVIRLLRDERVRDELARAGRTRMAQAFDVARCVETHAAVYAEALDRRGRRRR